MLYIQDERHNQNLHVEMRIEGRETPTHKHLFYYISEVPLLFRWQSGITLQ